MARMDDDYDDPDLEVYGDRTLGRVGTHRAGAHDLLAGSHLHRNAIEDYLFLRTGNGYPSVATPHDKAVARLRLPEKGWPGVVQYAAKQAISLATNVTPQQLPRSERKKS